MALAGPVIAAAVILPTHCSIKGLRDSSSCLRSNVPTCLTKSHNIAVSIGVGSADHRVIDRLNVLEATLLAMQEALKN